MSGLLKNDRLGKFGEAGDLFEAYVGATAPTISNWGVKYSIAQSAGSASVTIAGSGSNKIFFISDLLINPIDGTYKTTVRGHIIPTVLQGVVGTS